MLPLSISQTRDFRGNFLPLALQTILIILCSFHGGGAPAAAAEALSKSPTISMAQLNRENLGNVSITEVSNYVFGGYKGEMPSPPHADLNPRRAYVITWRKFPFRFVFCHEGSYCPWFEFSSGAGQCFQFFEGNEGWAELFNNFGRQEQNSFVDVLEHGPERVWVRWTYFGVNQDTGERAYRGVEDFWAFPNGHILRRQTFTTLMPGQNRGYAREPVEMIAMCPAGKLWYNVLQQEPQTGESHALAVLDAFSTNRYDVFWKRKEGELFRSTQRRTGCSWQLLDDSPGVAMVVPLRDGGAFCVMGDAGGFRHDFTRLKEHSFKDTGGWGWSSHSWDHWPIGWLNSQAHDVTAETLNTYPNHFSPAGMDFWSLPNEQVEQRQFYSLIGVGGNDLEAVRKIARRWLDAGEKQIGDLRRTAHLPATFQRRQ
jgi:hypothetical protein